MYSLVFLQDPEQLQESANQILTAIIQGMRKEEPSNNVKLAATNALLNSLEFTRANFAKEVRTCVLVKEGFRSFCGWCDWTSVVVFQMERHFIMQVVCEATQCPDTRVSNDSHRRRVRWCGGM